jgi:hypothetical protein
MLVSGGLEKLESLAGLEIGAFTRRARHKKTSDPLVPEVIEIVEMSREVGFPRGIKWSDESRQ